MLELLEFPARLQSVGLGQRHAGAAVDVERVRLPAAPVHREHQLCHQAFVGQFPCGEQFEFRNHLAVPPAGEFGIEQFLDGDDVRVLDRGGLGPRGARLGQVGEDRAAPDVERLAEHFARGFPVGVGGVRTASFGALREHVQVDAAGFDAQQIPGRVGEKYRRVGASAVTGQHSAQRGGRILQHLPRGRRNATVPEGIEQFARRDDPVRPQEQHAQHRALLDPAERHDPVLGNHFE